MPNTIGLKVQNEAWRQVGKETSAGPKAADHMHAERQKFAEFGGNANPVLLVQNAFPCGTCHAYFLEQSQLRSIIVKVEKNDGMYSADHAPAVPNKPGLPVIIYYYAGKATYTFKTPPIVGPPQGFPAHPDFADQQYY